MLDSNRTSQLREAIAIHLQNIGPEKWDLVRADFPEISNATFWRRVKEVRQELAEPLATKEPVVDQSGSAVPTDPAQEVIPKFGFYECIRQALRIRQLVADAEILKQQSLNKQGKILNHTMYTKSIILRERLLNSELQMMERWASINSMTEFYDRIMKTVAATSPEVTKKLVFELGMLGEEFKSKTDPHR